MALNTRDRRVTPPTWFSAFRELTLCSHVFLHAEIVIESDNPDPDRRWMRPHGGVAR